MALSFLFVIGALFLVVTAYVLGLALVRRRLGIRQQNIYNAVIQFVAALMLDVCVLYFAVSFCTSSTSDALRLRGHSVENQLIDSVARAFGAGSVDKPTQWGLIIPAVSWATAHAVVVLGLLIARSVFRAVSARRAMKDAEPDSEAHRAAKTAIEWSMGSIVGSSLFLIFFGMAFRAVVLLDVHLVRYQIIYSSKELTKALGKDWMAKLSEEQVYTKLGNSFLGTIVVDAGWFYIFALLVAAVFVVVTLHNLLHHMNTLPGRRYNPGPPPLDLPAGTWNGTPIVTAGAGAAVGGFGTTTGAGVHPPVQTATPQPMAGPEWYRSGADTGPVSGASNGAAQVNTNDPVSHTSRRATADQADPVADRHSTVDVPLEVPAGVGADVERMVLVPSE